MPAPQSYKNHARFDPPFHFFAALILLINVIVSVVITIHSWPTAARLHLWNVILSLGLLVVTFKTRLYALRVQDRVIRLEERMRLSALLPADERAQIHKLTEAQLVGLRFASDEEIPALVARTLNESLDQKAIKQAIRNWRADNFRV
ncbi:MAG: hypothetical protein KGK08_03985 [Acidobacteriota bacterium]|nr:hypothetical protein [Acidobacteriota bacterium]